ncbi:MAG: peptidase T [Spirochaetales bacterium]|nr:peptidase T [Spirochaetales bacterium]
MDLDKQRQWFEQRLLARFLRYVKVETTSDKNMNTIPSSKGQLDFAAMLLQELKDLKIPNAALNTNGFVSATLPASAPSLKQQTIGFIAHLDTTPDLTGAHVKPIVHENYAGKAIALKRGIRLTPKASPALKNYLNRTIITSDGTTLLGADDKAGVAEIMTALEFLKNHPQIPYPNIEIIFTPDEETGRGMSRFPLKQIKSDVCFTVDGGEEGTLEIECFEAYSLKVTLFGQSIHLGEARGKLINAVELAARLVETLPKNESPQATDGRFGYYSCVELQASIERARLEILIRDFTPKECKRRIKVVTSIINSLEQLYPGARSNLEIKKQYSNMRQSLKTYPKLVTILEQAIRRTGITPKRTYIRGGTDGARLSEMGVPTPNIFTGGHNFHSYREWIALPAMVRATQTIIYLAELWFSFHETHGRKNEKQ